jgi:phage/plasmid-associated DNA primase
LFDQAVLEIFAKSPDPEDIRRHLYEMFGYAIQPVRDLKQNWMWEGGGDNGKTGLADTLQNMVGDAATFSIKFSKIDSDYNLSAIKQCLLVRDNDVDWKTVIPDGIMKQLSEDASLTGRDPYGKPTGFKNCSLPLLLCNKYPMIRDLSHATQVRVHVIPFRRIFIDGKDMKRGLFKRIWETEMPGILNRSIEGLQRLRARGNYLEPEDCLLAKQEFLRKANPLPRFIAEACASTSTPLEQLRHQARLEVLRGVFEEPEKVEHISKGMECVEELIVVAMAKAESERLRCKLTTFYTEFWQWTRSEGILMANKPTRADVENYLINLGYSMTMVENQKWVDGVRPFPQIDERPEDGM